MIEGAGFPRGEFIDRELVLVKVAVDSKSRAEVMQITDIFRAKIVDVQPKSLTIEITGNESKIEKFLDLMKTFRRAGTDAHGQDALARKFDRTDLHVNRIHLTVNITKYHACKSLYG